MKLFWIYSFLFMYPLVLAPKVYAFEFISDPQYVVMNYAQINELNWAAPEDQWKSQVKPIIVAQVRDLKKALPAGTKDRRLAWSTLMEYMNFPMDDPGPDSVYVIKIRRILEITEEENIPVFIPLNGFQWWDELPELYNWWDPDGTNTHPSFFARQDSADFKERFVRGYNPENKWNVEWQNWETPMKLNWRNWGGGPFTLAPPPNLLRHTRTEQTYRAVLEARFSALIDELTITLKRWETLGLQDLFVGISIGTEVSLNASISATDFSVYGYRGIQDMLCDISIPMCGITLTWSPDQLTSVRQTIVSRYFNEIAPIAIRRGIPKQRLYTHIGEFAPGDAHYFPYAPSAFTPYTRPGSSFYAFAGDPYKHPVWTDAMNTHGFPAWGALEYSTDKTEQVWQKAMQHVFTREIKPAKIVVIYNWDEHKNTGAMAGIAAALQAPVISEVCPMPEIIPITPYGTFDPNVLEWKYFTNNSQEYSEIETAVVRIAEGPFVQNDSTRIDIIAGPSNSQSIPEGYYGLLNWHVEVTGCNGAYKSASEPRLIVISPRFSEVKVPLWVHPVMWMQKSFDTFSAAYIRKLSR